MKNTPRTTLPLIALVVIKDFQPKPKKPLCPVCINWLPSTAYLTGICPTCGADFIDLPF